MFSSTHGTVTLVRISYHIVEPPEPAAAGADHFLRCEAAWDTRGKALTLAEVSAGAEALAVAMGYGDVQFCQCDIVPGTRAPVVVLPSMPCRARDGRLLLPELFDRGDVVWLFAVPFRVKGALSAERAALWSAFLRRALLTLRISCLFVINAAAPVFERAVLLKDVSQLAMRSALCGDTLGTSAERLAFGKVNEVKLTDTLVVKTIRLRHPFALKDSAPPEHLAEQARGVELGLRLCAGGEKRTLALSQAPVKKPNVQKAKKFHGGARKLTDVGILKQ